MKSFVATETSRSFFCYICNTLCKHGVQNNNNGVTRNKTEFATDSHFKAGCGDIIEVYCSAYGLRIFRGIPASLGFKPCASNPVPSARAKFADDRQVVFFSISTAVPPPFSAAGASYSFGSVVNSGGENIISSPRGGASISLQRVITPLCSDVGVFRCL